MAETKDLSMCTYVCIRNQMFQLETIVFSNPPHTTFTPCSNGGASYPIPPYDKENIFHSAQIQDHPCKPMICIEI